MSARTYGSKTVQQVFDNQIITGTAKGTFVEAEYNSDAVTLMVGSDGEGARAMSADRSGTVKLTLLQTSPFNDVLSAALILDQATGLGTKSYFCKDARGSTLIHAAQCWVKKCANVVLADEIQGREWTIETSDLDVFVGGNA